MDNIDPHLYTHIQSLPDFNCRPPNHTLRPPTTSQAISQPHIASTRPASPPPHPRPIGTHPPTDHAPTPSTKASTSSAVPQSPVPRSPTAPLPPPQQQQHTFQPPYPPVSAPTCRPTISRPAYPPSTHPQEQAIPSITTTCLLPLPQPQNHHHRPLATPPTLLPPVVTKPGRVLHTILPPKNHIIRPNTPIRPFILSLPLGTPFHKRYKALVLFTRTHGSIVQSTFLAGPYFSYRDPVNNQIHFLINDILVPDGRWADELSYKVQVMESGLGVLDRDKKTWGNHWRETKEEKEGVVLFEGGSERSVMLFWYGTEDDGGRGGEGWPPEVGDDIGESGRRLLEEGVWGWVN